MFLAKLTLMTEHDPFDAVESRAAGDPHVEPDDEALAGPAGADRVGAIVRRELGEQAADTFSAVVGAQDAWERSHRPGEGLRERKKRLTRQRISDIATTLFLSRGFDSVTVSEIADAVGVSEKTVYNYFPTKESLVYDQADEQLRRLAGALRDRPSGASPSSVLLAELKREAARAAMVSGGQPGDFLSAFAEMIDASPALRAAWSVHRGRLVDTVTTILATDAGVDPRDPEPFVSARALVSLLELFYESQLRHVTDGAPAARLLALVEADLDRGARLLDTGLWSFHLMVEGRRTKQQLMEAAGAAEQARKQVLAALRQAKRTWRDLREEQRALARQGRAGRERHRRPNGRDR